MTQTTTQQVRQVLVNELGLTRESVREEARAFVEPIVKAEIARLLDQGGIREMVSVELSRLSQRRGNEIGVSIAGVVRQEAERAAREWFSKNIIIRQAE